MLLEQFDWGLDARHLQVLFGLLLGLVFGAAAQISRFCLRRAVAAEEGPDRSALSPWLMALATAIGGFALASANGLVDIGAHRFLSPELPLLAIVIGGFAFGAGMVLTRGCVSRLTVLSATGNLRAALVVVAFAVVAHATLKGVLAPLRTALGAAQIELPFASLAVLPGVAPLMAALLAAGAILLARQAGMGLRDVILGGVIGLVAVAGWVTTSTLLFDEFDPLPVQSAAFTLPWSDTLFWTIASSAIPAGFGTGLVAGVLLGAFLSAATRRELAWQSFETPAQTLRYLAGATLMGVGGVLAGGCTVGAGLSGSATLSVAALAALASIVAGGMTAARLASGRGVVRTA